jgi:hypothetical protein
MSRVDAIARACWSFPGRFLSSTTRLPDEPLSFRQHIEGPLALVHDPALNPLVDDQHGHGHGQHQQSQFRCLTGLPG